MKILLGILLLALYEIARAIKCDEGYFTKDEKCEKCHYSCITWSNSNSCLTCPDTRFLDKNTGLWETCPYGEYYDTIVDTWKSWDGRCISKWAYQFFCFECPDDEYFDLTMMEWTPKWTKSQVPIKDQQFHNIRLWRDLNIYVNPDSKELIELGTIKYPYKHLGAVFIELFNLHSHSDLNFTVLIHEKTANILEMRKNIIMNITQVSIDTYSEYNPTDPGRANITVVETPVGLESPSTVFSILKNVKLKGRLLH